MHRAGWKHYDAASSSEPVVSRPRLQTLNCDGLPFSRIANWLTEPRLMSLPCSDHCVPLVEAAELTCVFESLPRKIAERNGLREYRLKIQFASNTEFENASPTPCTN